MEVYQTGEKVIIADLFSRQAHLLCEGNRELGCPFSMSDEKSEDFRSCQNEVGLVY